MTTNWTSHADYQTALAGLRGRIVAMGEIGGWPAAIVDLEGDDVETGWAAAELLCRLAEQDAQTPDVAELAMWARSQCLDEEALARFLHAFVQERVTFAREPGERFAGTAATLAYGVGDCDDSARALYALYRAAGLPARLCFLVQEGQPAHVFCQVQTGGRWDNAETTLPAEFGEAPLEAAERLGIQVRPDLSGRAVTRRGPVPMGALGPSLIAPTGDANPDVSFFVRNGDRMRFVLAVSFLETEAQIMDGMTAIGFSCVNATLDRASLDLLEWPTDFTNVPAGAESGTQIAYVDATYAGDAKQLRLTWDFATVRDVRLVTGEASACGASSAGDGGAPAGGSSGDGGSGGGARPLTAADLPPLVPDPTDTASPRSVWLAAALKHAWFEAFGSDPAYPYNASLEQGILAVAALETDMGRANWADPVDAGGYSLRWNFGNVHEGSNPLNGFCPVGSKPHGDTRWDAAQGKYVPYTTCFQAYQSAVAGIQAMAKVMAGAGREDTRAALLAGDSTAIAHAMAHHGYYDAHAEPTYAAAIAAQAKLIAAHLGEPLAVAPGGAPSASGGAGVLLALVALAGASAYAYFRMRGA